MRVAPWVCCASGRAVFSTAPAAGGSETTAEQVCVTRVSRTRPQVRGFWCGLAIVHVERSGCRPSAALCSPVRGRSIWSFWPFWLFVISLARLLIRVRFIGVFLARTAQKHGETQSFCWHVPGLLRAGPWHDRSFRRGKIDEILARETRSSWSIILRGAAGASARVVDGGGGFS